MEDPTENEGDTTSLKPILLGGEDAMEEDENVPLVPRPDMAATSNELLSRIVTPSPYAHHTTGATAARFRNAMSRIATDPLSDVEAWQAIITEANTCYRNLQLHAVDADTHAKLDWIESCFGALLKNFPYAHVYYVSIVEMLLAQSARMGEEEGPLTDYGREPSQRVLRCEAKVEVIFQNVLGVEMDGSPVQDNMIGGMCSSSVELWLLYVRKRIRDANRHVMSTPDEKAALVRQWSTDAYEVAIKHCSYAYNNHLIWKQYLMFVKSWIPNPASNVDHALSQKQMVQLRSVFQRLASHPMTGLDQLWQEYEAFERSQNEALAAALIAEHLPKYQHARGVYLERNRVYNVSDLQMGRLATPPANTEDEDYATRVQEEIELLTLWKKRCSYERTNPERLAAADLVQRVRHAYKEMACALTRHPEAWHMWAMWELRRSGDDAKGDYAIAVLQLGQDCIPDCTLLAYTQSNVVELHTDKPESCIGVLERFVDRSPNTLGFVLYQQLVRRYKGVQQAREVFARARRVLSDSVEKRSETEKATPVVGETSKQAVDQNETNASGETEYKSNDGKRLMVTNRLGPDIGTGTPEEPSDAEALDSNGMARDATEESAKPRAGVITWHLYASHATMEHRLNHAPSVAARVYELGLRKHVSFLTRPPYVLKYAQLLLELDDTENLRALLRRAIAACQAQEGKSAEVSALWDMSLRLEAISSGQDATNVSNLDSVERRRHAALFGDDVEDVAVGRTKTANEGTVGGSANKSSISEQLIRSEGYDVSSSIVSGLSRTVNVLEIMGVLGNGETTRVSERTAKPASGDDADNMVGGVSDASYRQRLQFQAMAEAGLSPDAAGLGGEGVKTMSARERLHQATGGATGPTSAAALLIQQSPDWLRSLLLLLPASRFRTAAMNKPPPHMIEMALSSLRNNTLPADRPTDGNNSRAGGKRKRDGGDSSDEEDGNAGSAGGYGSQFRSRQRARQSGQINGSEGAAPHQ